MLLAVSHAVLATNDVPRITRFFSEAFALTPHFENDMFSEFVLPSGFRLAFFKPVGKSAKVFSADGPRNTQSMGLTVKNVDEFYTSLLARLDALGGNTEGPPKDHPWGEKSFLLLDCDGNRWEITQSPSTDGMLKNR